MLRVVPSQTHRTYSCRPIQQIISPQACCPPSRKLHNDHERQVRAVMTLKRQQLHLVVVLHVQYERNPPVTGFWASQNLLPIYGVMGDKTNPTATIFYSLITY